MECPIQCSLLAFYGNIEMSVSFLAKSFSEEVHMHVLLPKNIFGSLFCLQVFMGLYFACRFHSTTIGKQCGEMIPPGEGVVKLNSDGSL